MYHQFFLYNISSMNYKLITTWPNRSFSPNVTIDITQHKKYYFILNRQQQCRDKRFAKVFCVSCSDFEINKPVTDSRVTRFSNLK